MMREQLFELKFMKINPEELLYRIGIPSRSLPERLSTSTLSFFCFPYLSFYPKNTSNNMNMRGGLSMEETQKQTII
jgi:hypothetical protein